MLRSSTACNSRSVLSAGLTNFFALAQAQVSSNAAAAARFIRPSSAEERLERLDAHRPALPPREHVERLLKLGRGLPPLPLVGEERAPGDAGRELGHVGVELVRRRHPG